MDTEKLSEALENFLKGAQAILQEYYIRTKHPEQFWETLTIERGKRYAKIVRNDHDGHGRSVHCFVDLTNGDILKSASWRAPAKGARGNIFTSTDLTKVMGPHGAHYFR